LFEIDAEAANGQRRSSSLAAPEKLYSRIRQLRSHQALRLLSRRRRSLDPVAFEDKSFPVLVDAEEETERLARSKFDKAKKAPANVSNESPAPAKKLWPRLFPLDVQRTAKEAFEDQREGMLGIVSRAGVANSLTVMKHACVTVAVEQAERLQRSTRARPHVRALWLSTVLPGKLFVSPPPPRPGCDVDVLERRADLMRSNRQAAVQAILQKKRVAEAQIKSKAKALKDAADAARRIARKKKKGESSSRFSPSSSRSLTSSQNLSTSTLQPDDAPEDAVKPVFAFRPRSASIAAPERLAESTALFLRRAAVMRGQRAVPTKLRTVHATRQFANLTLEDCRTVPRLAEMTLSQWQDEQRLVETVAGRLGRAAWVRTNHAVSDSEEESSDSEGGGSDDDAETAEKRRSERRAKRQADRKVAKAKAKAESASKALVHESLTVDGSLTAADASLTAETQPDDGELDGAVPRWTEHYDEEGHLYYFDNETGESSWDPPQNDVRTDDSTSTPP